jgi:hypothetical protein
VAAGIEVRVMRWPILLIAFLAVTSAPGQHFELVQPSGLVTATIQISRGRLAVHEDTGERITYGRERRYDSRDDQYVGFVNVELNRVLRFPRSGEGRLQTADLDDVAPRFRYSRGQVRQTPLATHPPVATRPPATHPPTTHPPVLWPPVAGGPVGLPVPVDPYFYPPPTFPGAYFGSVRYPRSVLVDSRIVPNSPLPPARVDLYNGGRREIEVGLIDLQDPRQTRSMRIAPGQAAPVEVQRDAGGEEVLTYRTINFYGDVVTRNVVRAVAPQPRYEVVVHEWAMQSIAIDRTGKSPNPIEDINFQGRGVGRFVLPADGSLESARIDVYRTAIESGLAGTVAPIVASEDRDRGGDSPLQRALLEAQQRAQRGR